jgi:N-acetylglucosaminyldiphosphoundecaprenol N-acetyl-beta-D-mannosaminyltransferase
MKPRQLQRDVFCLLGLPLDDVTLQDTIEYVHESVQSRTRLFLTTPNLNFLVQSLHDSDFRQSMLDSDLCIADGMPLIWLSKLLGMGLPERVSGSDLYDHLSREARSPDRNPIKVYFFGGPPQAAQTAAEQLNAQSTNMRCVGFDMPGFGSVLDMSTPEIITGINDSQADFLFVALEAKKAQEWIEHNLTTLLIPVICDMGAVINFAAGTVRRAPVWMQRTGVEWLWRILEEPHLWRRYWGDFKFLCTVLAKQIIPYALSLRTQRIKQRFRKAMFRSACQRVLTSGIEVNSSRQDARLWIQGSIVDRVPDSLRETLTQATQLNMPIDLDLSRLEFFGPRFAGLLLIFIQTIRETGQSVTISGVSKKLRRIFDWNGFQ